MLESVPEPSVSMAVECSLAGAPRAAALVAVLTAVCLVVAFANGLPDALQWLLAFFSAVVGLRAMIRLIRPGAASLAIDERHLTVNLATGERLSGPVASAFVSPFFVGLRWRPGNRRWPNSLGIFREQMAPADFRRLSAALRARGES